ncbi:uncharacterized protein [Fopius arisanus]|uniref:Anon-3B1.2_6 protein n=1 Tax=Fopius arisanus TaxID=64838 RepID=A0A0C9RNV7_9HYME|nr:PREDICTED: uncharacterized protein LOC105270337 [Fopius arisanus]
MICYIAFILLLTWSGKISGELPPGVTPCPRASPPAEYDKCVLQQLELVTPQLVKGIPSLKIPPMDPLILPSLVIDRSLDAIKIKANLTGVRVYGGTNYKIDELHAQPDDLTVALKALFPYIHVKGNYDVKGSLLLLTLNGNGGFRGNFTNTQVRVQAQGREVTDKNGIRRVQVHKLLTKIRVGDGNIQLKAQPAYKAAADAAATFFNGSPRLVLDIINPIIEETATSIAKALAARAFGALTKDEILP